MTVLFLIFDVPNIAAFRVLCTGSYHMRAFADEIIQKGGGEGLILRRVASHYEHGRSLSLLKLKVLFFFLSFYFHHLSLISYLFCLFA